MATLSNSMIPTERVEQVIYCGFLIGFALMITHILFGKKAIAKGGRIAKIFVEFQRKSFHMIGGCVNCSLYHWGIKKGYFHSAYMADAAATNPEGTRLDGASAFIAGCFAIWFVEASRLMIPSVQTFFLKSFKGLIRDKEVNKASGVAYFIPGCVAAMMAAPSHFAIMGILFLSIGDAAASIGTAGGFIPVGTSPRKVEGSIGCFLACFGIGVYLGLSPYHSIVTALIVAVGEVLSEVIGLDDNLVIPMLGVLGIRIALASQFLQMAYFAGGASVMVTLLGLIIGATTSANQSSPIKKAKEK